MPARIWKHVGYLVPALAILTPLLVLVVADGAGLSDVMGHTRESSGLPAIAAITFGAPALVTYLLLCRMTRATRHEEQHRAIRDKPAPSGTHP